MPISDYFPHFGEGNLSTHYRNILGVPIRKRIVVAVIVVFGLFLVFVCGFLLAKTERRRTLKQSSQPPLYIPLTRSMNVSVDPCVNFYEFTCGLWSKNEAVLNSAKQRITSFELLQTYYDWKKRTVFEKSEIGDDLPRVVNDALTFFEVCLSRESDSLSDLKYLKSYFRQVVGGDWPVLRPEDWDDSAFDWTRASAVLMKSLGIETLFDVFSIVDDNNSSRRILYVRPPVIKDADYSQLESSTAPQMVYSVLVSLYKYDVADASYIIESILQSEIKWWKVFENVPAQPNQVRTTFKELKKMLPGFDWTLYFQTVMNDSLTQLNTNIFEDDTVLIDNFKVIEKAVAFFNSGNLSKVEIANLFGWRAAKKIWFLIPGVFEKYAEAYGYDANELQEATENKCFDILSELYESSVDYLFVKNSSHSCLPDGKVIVHYLKNALRSSLYSLDWLDNSTRESAVLKLDSMQSIIGFKSYLSNKTEFDAVYDGYPPVKPSLLQTYFETNAYFVSCLVSLLKADDKPIYMMPRSVTHVSAYYDTQKNIFTLPLSMYTLPFYYSNGPWYLNFGALGAVVGHEIMHGFDRAGCQRGETGSFKTWWTANASATYKEHSKCFSEQYSSYRNLEFKSNSSDRTLDEDIADNEGLQLAYLAYKQWVQDNHHEDMYSIFRHEYSPEQMFFIAFGSIWCAKIDPKYRVHLLKDRHSFPKWRVNGAVSNSKHFSEAFHCPRGSPMNPDHKCAIW